jgi:hypothetical protein
MNCDDFLFALETGGIWGRWAARRHAARCAVCQRAWAKWQLLKAELAAAPPLTGQQRERWQRIAQSGQVQPGPHYARRGFMLVVAASVLLVLFFWSVRNRHGPPGEPPSKLSASTPIRVLPITPESIAQEVAPLEQALPHMEMELAALSKRAALIDLKRQTEELLEEYQHW